METKTFVCKTCDKETLVDDGSISYRICGVCMRTTKGPGLTREGEDWSRSELQKKRNGRRRYVPFVGFVYE
uniref:Uncharacterized protein n=1 Tax=Marseillevirus sp. TaxID=2809551 RepID=A0AA96EMG0_9VIRU|nr:hypothetical protein MarFTMF_217 [Marseillevirus sp.]